jgi:hypothetical protein
MFNTLRTGVAAALTIVMLSTPLLAQQPASAPEGKAPVQSVAELEQQASQAIQDEKWVRLYSISMKLHKLRPFTPEYMLNIAVSAARLGQRQTALHYMLQMQQQGMSYDFNAIEGTEPTQGSEAYDYINDLLIKAGQPAGEGTPVLDLDVEPFNLGGFTWDSSRGRFLVGTRTTGELLAVADNGDFEVLLKANEENGLWSIDGLAVDTERKRLWIASSATPVFESFTPTDRNHGALFEFDLETLEPVGRFNLPVDGLQHELGSVAVTAAGDAYVIDRATPLVFRKAADGDRLEAFAGSPQLVALTDIAVTPDNSRVFVSDAVLGILLIDPAAHRSTMLTGQNLNLFGIYGIEFAGGNLLVTQSDFSPQRILRLELDAKGTVVSSVAPMAIALEGFDTPGTGTLRDGSIYYFANHGSQTANSLSLMSTPLDAGNEIKPPDMRQFEEALKNATKNQQ